MHTLIDQVFLLQAQTSSKHAISMDGLSTLLAAQSNRSSAQPRGEFFAGLSKKDAYIRLIDAYRLRVDDDYVWGGGDLHG